MNRKLDSSGYQVGRRLVEKMTRDKPRIGNVLDVVKFLCRDFWSTVFGKQVDKLQTNHKGVYVLQDTSFKWFSNMSSATDEETTDMARRWLFFPCGMIRGALEGLGIDCIVSSELAGTFPHCNFNVRVKDNA